MNRIVKALVAFFAIAAVLVGCSAPSTPSDEVFVHKGSGVTEGKESKGCVEPGQREIFWGQGMGDDFFAYPASQRYYDFSQREGGDAPPFTVVSADGQQLDVPGRTDFTLNTNCDILTKFHDLLGNRENAYIQDSEDGARVSGPGWLKIINNYFRLPIDSALDGVAKNYTWRELRFDLAVKDEMNKAANEALDRLVNQQIGSEDEDFFLNFQTLVQQPVAPADLVKTETDRETAVAQAATAQAKAKAESEAAKATADIQVIQKRAELEVKKIDAAILREEISARGGPALYNEWLIANKGLNPRQPTYGGQTLVTPEK